MPKLLATVAVPTLAADSALTDCLASLAAQTLIGFDVVVIDNSGRGLVRRSGAAARVGARLIEMERNVGFGSAINAAWRSSEAPYLAALNDDAVACPRWLAALVETMERRADVGMCASQVRLDGEGRLDSAGMLIYGDGTSKQRGHLGGFCDFPAGDCLLPSGSAALYRRAMLDRIGMFDPEFFLYCEDTDLGLRGIWNGWKCAYVPEAVVEHRYSHSAGRASPLKAYYVERNRIFVAVKNFPLRMWVSVPLFGMARYAAHVLSLLQGRGTAARFREEGHGGWRLVWFAVRAHLAVAWALPRLLRQRRSIRRNARIEPSAFHRLLRSFSIGAKEVSEL